MHKGRVYLATPALLLTNELSKAVAEQVELIPLCQSMIPVFKDRLHQLLEGKIPEKQKIIDCFLLCGTYWDQLRDLVSEYHFKVRQEEIHFFKILKPTFTSEMEYYSLLCQADMFKPEHDKEAIFWSRELDRFESFLRRHKDFISYYKCGRTDQDEKYFIRNQNEPFPFPISKIYREDSSCATGYDHIVACYLAQVRYREFVLVRLKQVSLNR